MNVLVCGANGLIGRALCQRLADAGHQVVRGVHRGRESDAACAGTEIAIDYQRDLTADVWRERVAGVDALVNAVGILTETADARFEAIHHLAPVALFDACRQAGGRRIVQISALGAPRRSSAYYRTKHDADRHLLALPGDALVLRPSLVFSPEGASTRLFAALASLPVHGLPAGGHPILRPIDLAELAELAVRWIESGEAGHREIDAVGGDALAYRDLLALYRSAGWARPALTLSLPRRLVGLAAALGEVWPGTLLNRDTWAMFEAGSTADATATADALGRAPRGIRQAVREHAGALREAALTATRAPLHLPSLMASAALYGACALDALFGVLTLIRPRRGLWIAQAALVTAYTLVLSVTSPMLLAEPFGPLTKNAPILAVLLILAREARRPPPSRQPK